jgi:hypothetical protein
MAAQTKDKAEALKSTSIEASPYVSTRRSYGNELKTL